MAGALAIDLRPDPRKLRAFGWVALAVLGTLGALTWHARGPLGSAPSAVREPLALGLLALALCSAVLSLLYPRGNRALYLALVVLGYPFGVVLSHALLALIFYGVLTPIGLLLRVLGKDLLERRSDPGRASYWTTRGPARDKASYFRMF